MRKLTILSAAHFCVDMCCAALFFGWLSREANSWLYMVLYNACAFLMQLPMGLIADKLNRNMLFSAAGCVLVAAGFLLKAHPVMALVVAGFGNGAFHVGGGIEVLNRSQEKAGPLGVFVSPGAIGLYLGQVYAAFFHQSFVIVPALMLICAGAILLTGRKEFSTGSGNEPLSLEMPRGGALLLAFLFIGFAQNLNPRNLSHSLPLVSKFLSKHLRSF